MVQNWDQIQQRTELVGKNRLELLLFNIGDGQHFAINVFKVREAIHCPEITPVPNAHQFIIGVSYLRGEPIPVIDLAYALGRSKLDYTRKHFVIVAEFSRHVQGFLVNGVDRIVNLNWSDILPPPPGMDTGSFLTAVTYVGGELIQVLDVEKVLSDVIGLDQNMGRLTLKDVGFDASSSKPLLVVDDSNVARNQIRSTLKKADINCILVNDGRKALDQLKSWANDGPIGNRISMVISDIEMPQMDGYTLVSEIRKDPRLENLFVLLHSSLSGVFNSAMVKRAGADAFLPKFSTQELLDLIVEQLEKIHDEEVLSF